MGYFVSYCLLIYCLLEACHRQGFSVLQILEIANCPLLLEKSYQNDTQNGQYHPAPVFHAQSFFEQQNSH